MNNKLNINSLNIILDENGFIQLGDYKLIKTERLWRKHTIKKRYEIWCDNKLKVFYELDEFIDALDGLLMLYHFKEDKNIEIIE